MFVFLGLAIALVFVTGISAGAEPDDSIRAKRLMSPLPRTV